MTATTTRRPFLTGFCGLTMPADSHRRCPGVLTGHACTCTCHTQTTDGDVNAAPTATSAKDPLTAGPLSPAGVPASPSLILTGVPLPPLEPGSQPWLRTMSASKIAAVVGLSPYESRFSLWHRMAGLIPAEDDGQANLRRGHYLEPGILAWLADEHPDWTITRTGSWAHPQQPLFTASPDGQALLPTGEIRGVELKTAADDDEWGEPGTDQIPVGYACQVQWQMLVTGVRVTHVAVLSAYLTLREYLVEANPSDQAFLAEQAQAFLDSLPTGPRPQRPDLDSHGATYEAVRRLHPDIDDRKVEIDPETALRYIAAVEAAQAAVVELTAAKALLLDEMGTAKRACHAGQQFAIRKPGRGGSVALAPTLPKATAA